MFNFGNIDYKTELELKVSLLEKEHFEQRDQVIAIILIIKQLRTNSKSYPFTTIASTTTNTITTPAQSYDNINRNNDKSNNNNNSNNINSNNCKNKNKDNNNKNNKIMNTKENNNSTNKNETQLQEIQKKKYIFHILKRMKSRQTKMIYHNQTNISILPKPIEKSHM